MNNEVDVSFITINYNSSEHTIKLVQSIIKNTEDVSYEIIIVDNASQDADFLNLKNFVSNVGKIKLIRSRINSGFSGGNMLGVNYAMGEYWFFINNDSMLSNNSAKILKNFLDANEDVAVSTATILNERGDTILSYGLFPSVVEKLFGRSAYRFFQNKKFLNGKSNITKPSEVDIISGSCMFFKAKCFCSIGGFDTMFFLYSEEEDICKRVWNYGKKVYYVPDAKIYHIGGGSTNKSFEMEREFYISYYHLINKHYNFFGQILIKFSLFMKLFFRIFKRKKGFKMFVAMIIGFPNKNSLRYKQTIVNSNLNYK